MVRDFFCLFFCYDASDHLKLMKLNLINIIRKCHWFMVDLCVYIQFSSSISNLFLLYTRPALRLR